MPEWHEDFLSGYFAEDFALFSVQDFKVIDSDTTRSLQNPLRKREIYVPKGRNTPIANSLHYVAQEDLQWTDDDPEKPADKSCRSKNVEVPRLKKEGDPNEQNIINSKRQTSQDKIKKVATHITSSEGSSSPQWKRRNMASLFKAYGDDSDKYKESRMDNFERKVMLFWRDARKPIF